MIIKTKFKDLVIHINKPYRDKRGYLKELLRENKIKKKFVVSILSFSKKNVLRGLHFQTKNPQGKYISVLRGKIFDVAVDIRKGSPTFLNYVAVELSPENGRQLVVPKGFAHGFQTLTDDCLVLYKVDQFYSKEDDQNIIWSDAEIAISWPIDNPILSAKDAAAPALAEANINFEFMG